jgi:peptide/nickel transport system substrate-binding protein
MGRSRSWGLARRSAVVGAFALAVAACGGDGLSESAGSPTAPQPVTSDPGAPGTAAAAGSTSRPLRLLVPQMPGTFAMVDLSSNSLAASLLVTEPVVAFQPDGTFEPLLAEELEQVDATTYRITLRDGVTFSDGSPLTAEDVVFSFEIHTAEDSTSAIARYWRDVQAIEIVGDRQIEVSLGNPDPDFPYTLAKTGITSRAHHERHGDEVGTPTVPQLGTGPYVYARFTPNVSVELAPNPNYWGTPAPWPSVHLELAADDASRLLALQSGDFDGVFLPPLTQVDQIAALGSYTEYSGSDVALYRIGLDVTKPPFDDIHVRRAIAHAVDRDAVVAGAFGGRAEVADSFVPEETLDILGDPDAVADAYATFADAFTFDLDLARQELAQSSSPDGFAVDVPVPASDATVSLIAQTIAQDLAEIGIELDLRAVDDATYGTALYVERDHDGLTIDSWNAGSPEPGNLPFALVAPGAIGNTAQVEVAAALEAITAYKAATPGSPEQLDAMLEALTLTHDEMAYIPLAFPDVYAFVDDDVVVDGFNSFWWLTPLTQTLRPR